MVPKDLTEFSVEQLRGFATAVAQEIAEVKAAKLEGAFSADQLTRFETLVDDQIRLHELIQAAAEGDEAEAAVEEAVATDDATEDEEAEDDEAVADADAVVDEAVASMTLGGGSGPRVTRDEADKANGDVKKFVRNMVNGSVRHEERHSFTTMKRETNHIVREGANATDAMKAAVLSRADGTDKTAAACFCGPEDVINGIRECCDSVRPLSDSLPTITASGDVRYVRGVDLADALTGITEWTCVDQDAVDPSDPLTWKPCFELECPPEVVSCMYAISACATFNTQQLIGNPELIANLENVMQCAFSKTAELLLYNRLRALSSRYSFGYDLTGYGASSQLLAAVGWAMEAIRANLRVANPNYTLALPAGLLERVLTDGVIRGMDEYRTRDDLFDRLRTLGVANVIELADEIACTPGGALPHAPLADPGVPTCPATVDCTRVAAPQHPVNQEILLYRPEDFVLGVGPDIDLGIVRSPELARQNKLQWFTEGFEFLEKLGCGPAIDLVVPFCASGVRPALGTGEDCTDE